MAQAAAQDESRRRYWQWRVLLALMGCYLFYYTGRLAIGHALPLIEAELGYSKERLGWLTAAALAAYGVGQAVNGNLGDAIGGRRMVALGALGSMLLCWAFSFAQAAPWLFGLWAANGLAQSMGWAPGGRLIAVWWPRERRGLAFGLYMLAAGMAAVLVWCTSDLVLAFCDPRDPGRWRWLFRLPLAALGAAGIAFYLLVRDAPEDVGLSSLDEDAALDADVPPAAREDWLRRYRAVLSNPWFLLAALVIAFQSFSRYGLLTWTASYYADAGLSLNRALRLTLGLPIGMGLGALAGGYLSDRWFLARRPAVVALFLAASAAGFAALAATPVSAAGDHRPGIALLFLTGFFVYGAQGPLWAMCPELVGRAHSATAVGLMDAVAYAAAAAQGPVLGSIVGAGAAGGYAALFVVLAIVTLCGALLALVSAATIRPDAAAGSTFAARRGQRS